MPHTKDKRWCPRAAWFVGLVLGILLSNWPTTFSTPRAQAGTYCAGNREWLASFLEQATAAVDSLITDMTAGLAGFNGTGFRWIRETAGWALKQDRIQSFQKALANPIDPLDVTFKAAVNQIKLGVEELAPWLTHPKADEDVFLESLATNLLEAQGLCQAIGSGNPDKCQVLAGTDPTRAQRCIIRTLRLGVLLPLRCTPETVQRMSEAIRLPAEQVTVYCEALSQKDPNLCDRVTVVPEQERAICRALAGQGEPACISPAIPPDKIEKCRLQVWESQFLQHRLPFWEKPPFNVDALELFALKVSRSPEVACNQALLEFYDLATAFALELQ